MVAGLRVTPETVLGVRAVIMEEVTLLRLSVRNFRRGHGQMPSLGGDPVSPYAARGFNEVTEQLLAQCEKHIQGLQAIGDELAAAAKAYGMTEMEITDSFDPNAVQYVPELAPAADAR